jgi:hypothetical protein
LSGCGREAAIWVCMGVSSWIRKGDGAAHAAAATGTR